MRIDTPGRWVRRVVAATVLVAATTATLVGVSAPAGATACSSATGVSVVVDFTGATGGIRSACVPGMGDQPASAVLEAAGFPLTWVQRQPGFLCRVDGVPAADPCVNTPPQNAYWGLFWSDGVDGTWHYSDIGVGGLQVPEGGYVGLAWQSGTRRAPGQAAAAHPAPEPAPAPTAAPAPSAPSGPTGPTGPSGPAAPGTASPKPTRGPQTHQADPKPSPKPDGRQPDGRGPATPTTSATPSPTPSATDGAEATEEPAEAAPTSRGPGPAGRGKRTPGTTAPTPTASPTASPSASPSDEPAARSDAVPADSGRVPTWLTLTILVLLLGAIGVSTVAARRRTRP